MTPGPSDLAQTQRPDTGLSLRSTRRVGCPVPCQEDSLGPLGQLVYAGPGSDVAARLLQPMAAHDRFDADAPVQRGHTGPVRWARAGHWCWGAIDCAAWDAEADTPADVLTDAAQSLYTTLFDFLAATDTPHLLRVWNYLPHINRDEDGLERYRRFNQGRQRAMLAAHRPAFEGAPAACALGVHHGPLVVRFLAGTQAPLPIENPRQVSAYHYPADYGPASPSFSRAAACDMGGGQWALLVSGTASIVGHATLHAGDWRAQLAETLRNLEAVYQRARERCQAAFHLADSHCVLYLRDPALAEPVREAFTEAVGAGSVAARTLVTLQADVCRSDLLLEIEAHAWAPGPSLATR